MSFYCSTFRVGSSHTSVHTNPLSCHFLYSGDQFQQRRSSHFHCYSLYTISYCTGLYIHDMWLYTSYILSVRIICILSVVALVCMCTYVRGTYVRMYIHNSRIITVYCYMYLCIHGTYCSCILSVYYLYTNLISSVYYLYTYIKNSM